MWFAISSGIVVVSLTLCVLFAVADEALAAAAWGFASGMCLARWLAG